MSFISRFPYRTMTIFLKILIILNKKSKKIIVSKKITLKDINEMKCNQKKILDSSIHKLFNDLNDC